MHRRPTHLRDQPAPVFAPSTQKNDSRFANPLTPGSTPISPPGNFTLRTA